MMIEIAGDLRGRDKGEPVVARRRFDVAISAGEIAERTRVDPERLEPGEGNGRPPLPLYRHGRITELGGIERGRRSDRSHLLHIRFPAPSVKRTADRAHA